MTKAKGYSNRIKKTVEKKSYQISTLLQLGISWKGFKIKQRDTYLGLLFLEADAAWYPPTF